MTIQKLKQRKLGNSGFSLVELIIVIAIMAILIAVLAPLFIRYVERSRISTDISAIGSMGQALKTAVIDPGNGVGTGPIVLTWACNAGTITLNQPANATLLQQQAVQAVVGGDAANLVTASSVTLSGATVTITMDDPSSGRLVAAQTGAGPNAANVDYVDELLKGIN